MSWSRLQLYNAALTICGERTVASLTEDREPRRLLDQVWNDNGVKRCLEMAQWKFAMRAVKIDSDPDFTDEIDGYQYAFNKPSDWVLTSAVCQDGYFRVPLTQYSDENVNWYADIDPIYVKYVSNDSAYGGDLSLWPQSFGDYVAAHFAGKIVPKLTSDKERRDRIIHPRDGIEARYLKIAKSKDAMAGPTSFPPAGSWVQARRGGSRRRDGGSRNNLIG